MANSYTTRLKKRLPAVGDVNWDDEWHDNEKLDEVIAGALLSVNRVVSGGAVTAGAGLTADYSAAVVWLMGTRLEIAAGSLVMTAAQAGQQLVNWLYVNASGIVTASTTPPSGDYIPLALVDTDSAGIVRIADLRPMSALDKDAAGGVPGLTDLKINFMNALGTIASFFTNANTLARTYTFPDRDGIIADGTDLALKANLASPAFTGTPTAPSPVSTDDSTKIATTAYVANNLTLKANLASPAFTGSPTAPTPANTDNSTKLATTAHIANILAGAMGSSGYQKLGKSGLVVQWGISQCHATIAGEALWVAFPVAFTTIYALCTNPIYPGTAVTHAWTDSPLHSGFGLRGSVLSLYVNWIAIGYITPA